VNYERNKKGARFFETQCRPYLAPLLRYSDLLAKNHKFCPLPSHLAPSLKVTSFEFKEKLYGSWN